jgi:hypothetical protein
MNAVKKRTWIHFFQPLVESRVRYGSEGVDICDPLKGQLDRTDVQNLVATNSD